MRGFRFREAKEVIVKRLVTTQDELGGDIEQWQAVGTIKAEIWPLRGNVTRGEMGVTDKSTHRAFASEPGTFESNTRLIAADRNMYLVGYVQNWGSHLEAILEHVGVEDIGSTD